MANPPVITPIRKPTPPVRPAAPAPPFVLSLPQAASAPSDAELRKALGAIGTPEANALLAAYDAFGNKDPFAQKLAAALIALPMPGDAGHPLAPWLVHIARLGAEAFVLDVAVGVDKAFKAFQVGLIDHPDRLSAALRLHQQAQFLHFAVRRLFELSSARFTPDVQRGQMDKAIVLFRLFQTELARGLVIDSKVVLIAYRQLMFKIVQTHYQALLDGLFVKSAGGATFADAVKKLEDHFKATLATDLAEDPPPTVPLYHIERSRFRDYFQPPGSEFRFAFYSHGAPPLASEGPEIAYRSVLRKRLQQGLLLNDLRPGSHPVAGYATTAATATLPEPPKLHENILWQAWARTMWDKTDKSRTPVERLQQICLFVRRYFYVFTSHVPYDLAEGSKEANYLTRPYPRAITGGLVHDCVVYAIRWIFILGRLFASPAMPRELGRPRISLIEMPVHVGVMLRANLSVDKDVLIAANNQEAVVDEIDASLTDLQAAESVVEGMYRQLTTVIVIRKLGADPTKATALWNEIAKLSDRKLRLPYDDPSEPWMLYLNFNAQSAAIARDLAERVGDKWRAMNERLDAVKPADKRKAVAQELKAYRADIESFLDKASKAFNKDVAPLATAITADVNDHRKKIPKDAEVIEGGTPTPGWQFPADRYRAELDRTEKVLDKSLDLSKLDPDEFFPEDAFPTDVQ